VILAHASQRLRHPAQYAAQLIAAYQRYVSPHKGFACAVRVRRGGLPCSEFAKRIVLRRGVIGAAQLVRRRLRVCAATVKSKPTLDYHPLPVPPEPKRTKRQQARDCASDALWGCDAGCDASDAFFCASADCGDCSPW